MKADNVGLPLSKFQWNYIRKSAEDLRESFNSSNAIFAPACMSHTVHTKRSWTTVEIDSISLPQAIRCWELSLSPIEHRKRHHKLTIKEGAPTIESSIQLASSPALLQSDEPKNMSRRKLKNIVSPSLPYKLHHKQRNKVKQKNSRNKNKNRRKNERKSKRKETKKERKNDRKKRRHREEMEFIELLGSFSADLSGLASALGLEVSIISFEYYRKHNSNIHLH
ncbi:palmitoleoyl-protein carboxylesterase NOTUM-like isoform X1 [Artemia franciscana]